MDAHLIESALRAYFGRAPHGIAAAYFFGSEAAGRAHAESDVDVGVLLDRAEYPTASDRFEARVRIGSDLIAVLNRNEVDVVVLNDAPPGLGRRIITEGIRVYRGDAELDHTYVRDVQLLAADVDVFLRRMEKVKLAALRR